MLVLPGLTPLGSLSSDTVPRGWPYLRAQASVAGSVDGATTLSGRSGMRHAST